MAPPRRTSPPDGPTARESLLVRTAPWLGLAVLLAAAATAYRPAMGAPFVLDDWGSIEANMRLRSPDAFALPGLADLLGPGRPLTELTFALDFRSAGLDPVRFHVVGLLLHLAAGAAAYLFLSSLLRRAGHPRPRAVALLVTGAFVLHPVQVESVAYAAQRAEVLASLLALASLTLLDRAAARLPRWPGWAAWGGGTLAWLAGMGAKTIAITTPGLFLLDQGLVAPGGERGRAAFARRAGRALLVAAPLLLLAAWSVSLHLRAFAATKDGSVGFAEPGLLGPAAYFLTQLRVQWLYLAGLAWPPGLAFDRDFTPSTGIDGPAVAAALGVALLLALAVWLWVRAERADGPRPAGRLAAFGILFWFVALSPTSTFVPIADLAVEHRVYLASLGPFLAVAVGADALLARLLPRPRSSAAGMALAGVLLLALGLGLAGRAHTWGSAESLWEATVAVSPGNARAWINLGLARSRAGRIGPAEEAYRRAWESRLTAPRAASLARNHAALLIDSGRTQEALSVLDEGLAIAPQEPSLHANRAAALSRLGRRGEAIAEARQAVALAPGDPLMRNVLGQALTGAGDWTGALAEFRAASSLDPRNPFYAAAAAVSLSALGQRDEACAAFRQARAIAGPRPLPLDAAGRAAALGCPIPGP